MSASRGRLSREDVIGKVPRVSMGLDKSPHAITSSHGSDSNRRSLSIANIATSAFFKRGADGLWIPKYQNSYRLEPYNRFKPEVTDKIIKTIMDKKLDTVTAYDPVQASKLNMEIINEVLKALIKKDFDRCKLVVQASVMQNAFQSINVGLGCLWDIERDNYSYYVYQNTHIHAWCAVFVFR